MTDGQITLPLVHMRGVKTQDWAQPPPLSGRNKCKMCFGNFGIRGDSIVILVHFILLPTFDVLILHFYSMPSHVHVPVQVLNGTYMDQSFWLLHT